MAGTLDGRHDQAMILNSDEQIDAPKSPVDRDFYHSFLAATWVIAAVIGYEDEPENAKRGTSS